VIIQVRGMHRSCARGDYEVQEHVALALITAHDESVELRHLVSFDAVVRHGGFTRAAEALHLAQPAVSAHVRALETELGATLLTRTTRRVALTHAGELVLARTRRVLAELDGARADLDAVAGVVAGRVRIGAIQALEPLDLPAALAAFVARYPGVDLELGSGPTRRLVADLEGDRLDLALGPIPADLPAHLTATALFSEELVLITPATHRLAGGGTLAMSALRDERFVCLPPDSGLRAILDREAARAGFRPVVPIVSTNLARLRELVAHGLGVALLARSVAEAPIPPGHPGVVTHSVDPTPVRRTVGLLHRADRPLAPAPAACAAFLAERRLVTI
jgi:DNA-binding transcriptional LysR family regulator